MRSLSRAGNKSIVFAGLIVSVFVFIFAQSVFASSSGTLLPNANGNYTQWTPSTGTSHFALVDESSCNGTTDYNSTTVVGNRDSYVVSTSSIPNGAIITNIDIKPCASRSGTGTGTSVMNVFYRFGGVNSSDAGSYSFTSGNTPAEQATTSFNGLSLLQTSTTTLEVGVVNTSGTKGLRLSRIAVVVTYTALAAPSNLVTTATTTSAIGLTWTNNSATTESGVAIERGLSTTSFSGIATTSAGATSYYDSGLSAGTRYYYRARSFNFGAYTSYSNTASSTTLESPPAAPSALAATASTTQPKIALNWTDNSSNETNFEVLRGTDGINFSHLSTTSANVITFTDSGLASLTTYYYEVRGYNNGGYSDVSASASATTNDLPASASDLSAVASTTALRIDLAWSDNASNELSYSVERSSVSSTTGFSMIKKLGTDTVSYTDTTVASSITYFYRVSAVNGYGTSTASNVSSDTSASAPAAPSGLTAIASSTKLEIGLTWTDNSSNELKFEVLRSTNNVTFLHLATTTQDTVAYTDTSVLASTTYYYKVRAYDFSYSSSTSAASATTPMPPVAPSGLTLTQSPGTGTSTDITLNWTDNSADEFGFIIERKINSSPFTSLATTTADITSYLDLSLSSGNYTYRLRAFNAIGNSASTTATTTIP